MRSYETHDVEVMKIGTMDELQSLEEDENVLYVEEGKFFISES